MTMLAVSPQNLAKYSIALALLVAQVFVVPESKAYDTAANTEPNLEPSASVFDGPSVARQLLRDSVAIPTVEGAGLVPKLANHLTERLLAGGFSRQQIQFYPLADTGALLVRYPGKNPALKPILLSAHMDVVGAERSDWQRDPFVLVEEDGYLFGRGVFDDKWGLSMLLTTLLDFKQQGYQPERGLVLLLTGDEESTMATTQMMVTQHLAQIDAQIALVADGGGGVLNADGRAIAFMVDNAEKTYATFKVTARNPGGHSSMPRADNAIYQLAQALNRLAQFQFPVQAHPLIRDYFAKAAELTAEPSATMMRRFAVNPQDSAAVQFLRAKPEFVGSLSTTCVATQLQGGHAENALPQSAEATINCRIFPGETVAQTLATLKQLVADDTLQWQILGEPVASAISDLDATLQAQIAAAVHRYYPDIPVIPHMASGASDALHYRAAGIPSYVLMGLFINPDDDFTHGLNERVPVAAIPVALGFWRELLMKLTTR